MPDLIFNINFQECRNKNKVVIETFLGTIPHLKSKKYSGQLRPVNVNGLDSVDNMSQELFDKALRYLRRPPNIQISKNQYIISNRNLNELKDFSELKFLFYKADKKGSMFQAENIFYGNFPENTDTIKLDGVILGGKASNFYVSVIQNEDGLLSDVEAEVYVNLQEKNYPLDLVFNYKNIINGVKNFGFENAVKEIIVKNNWIYKQPENIFVYNGRDINRDLSALIEAGINVFTNTKKKITTGNFSKVRVSYNIDWFEVKGTVDIDNENLDIGQLINLKNQQQNWSEYDERIILLPKAFKNAEFEKNENFSTLRIKKKNIVTAMLFSYDLNKRPVEKLENYLDYSQVELKINKKIENILRPYQITGVKWLLSLQKNKFGGCLADDMGLGKTLQVIAFLSDESLKKSHSLIIVPKTLLINWLKEFQKFIPGSEIYIYHGSGRNISDVINSKTVLTTYGTVLNDIEKLKDLHFKILILDEAQYVKNSDSKTYKALLNIQAETKIILTGTPIENNLQEFWGLMRLINRDSVKPFNLNFKGMEGENLLKKIKVVTAPFILRRLKKEVLEDLPEKQEEILYCEMGEEQESLYKNILASVRLELLRKNERYEIKDNSIILKGLLYLQEICCHPSLLDRNLNQNNCCESAKLDVLENLLQNAYNSGHKIVIFSRFVKMLKIIEKRLNFFHMNYFYLDGTTKDRISLVQEFENSQTGVFLISLKAGGTGLNLVSADIAVIYDPWWNPAVEKQAEDRIYRIGQKNNVIIYRLITVNTIEEKIYKLQADKQNLYDQVLEGHEMPQNLTAEIIEKLLSENDS